MKNTANIINGVKEVLDYCLNDVHSMSNCIYYRRKESMKRGKETYIKNFEMFKLYFELENGEAINVGNVL